jgi:hypothetical protein
MLDFAEKGVGDSDPRLGLVRPSHWVMPNPWPGLASHDPAGKSLFATEGVIVTCGFASANLFFGLPF